MTGAENLRHTLLLMPLLLAACASAPATPVDTAGYKLSLSTDSVLQRRIIDRDPLLDSSLQFAAPAQWLNYDVRYSLQPPLLASDQEAGPRNSTVLPGQLLGTESLRQSLRMQLPFLLGQPLRIEAEDRYRGLLTPQAPTASRSAQLQWSPASLALGLRWTPVDDQTGVQPFSCQLAGSIELPGALLTGRDGDGLRLLGRGCRALAPDRGIAERTVNSYSATWEWRRRKSDSSVHLLMIEPAAGPAAANGRAAAGYEFGASRTQKWRQLLTLSSVALRRTGEAQDRGEPLDWSAKATIRTELTQASLSASYQRASDPLWFLPGQQNVGNSIELGLGLDRWIARQLTLPNVGLGMVWRRTEAIGLNQPADNLLMWNFTLRQ